MSNLEQGSKTEQLTCIAGGADVAFASCPELALTCFDSGLDIHRARRNLFQMMDVKATKILEQGENFPFKEWIAPAKLFINNREQVQSALLNGESVLVTPPDSTLPQEI